jgi:hypothetical protein
VDDIRHLLKLLCAGKRASAKFHYLFHHNCLLSISCIIANGKFI